MRSMKKHTYTCKRTCTYTYTHCQPPRLARRCHTPPVLIPLSTLICINKQIYTHTPQHTQRQGRQQYKSIKTHTHTSTDAAARAAAMYNKQTHTHTHIHLNTRSSKGSSNVYKQTHTHTLTHLNRKDSSNINTQPHTHKLTHHRRSSQCSSRRALDQRDGNQKFHFGLVTVQQRGKQNQKN